MPKKFSFSSSDMLAANRWLEAKLSINNCESRQSIFTSNQSLDEAKAAFSLIDSYNTKELHHFCLSHLTPQAFTKLKGTLRAARKRQRALSACGNKKRSIDLDFWAHTVLAGVARSKGVTLSQIIIERFESEYLDISSKLKHSE